MVASVPPSKPLLPEELRKALGLVAEKCQTTVHVSGGTLRDWLLGLSPRDIDITVPCNSRRFIEELRRQLGGTVVALDKVEEVYRLVCKGLTVDCADYRQKTTAIQADLQRRDFTVNALAVALEDIDRFVLEPDKVVVDPTGGLADLGNKVIRCTSPSAFDDDPLRLLRAYRFAATLNFIIDPSTRTSMTGKCAAIVSAAAERIMSELDGIVLSGCCHKTFAAMHEDGLLASLFPEMMHGVGMDQPSSHHLDVFGHSMAALAAMEKIIVAHDHFFKAKAQAVADYLESPEHRICLLYAAFFHDLGKPVTHKIREDKGGRITFYNHDRAGGRIFNSIANRYKWSKNKTAQTALFIENHMWPFHLINASKRTGLTRKACLRLVKTMGEDMPGLFAMAMADSIASQGENRPPWMEDELASLFDNVEAVRQECIEQVLKGPRLVTGRDLIEQFGLQPGPLFRSILDELEQARVDGLVADRRQALLWVADHLAENAMLFIAGRYAKK